MRYVAAALAAVILLACAPTVGAQITPIVADPLGVAVPVASGGAYDFGSVDRDGPPKMVTFRYSNTTGGAVSIDCAILPLESIAGEFAVIGLPTLCMFPGDDAVLADGVSIDFVITFDPAAAGLGTVATPRSTLVIHGTGSPATYHLNGTGTEAELEVTKTLTSGNPTPVLGETVTFTVTLKNKGSATPGAGTDAVGMTVADVMGPGYTNVTTSGPNASVTAPNTVTWTPAGVLVPGASTSITVSGDVAYAEISDHDFWNTATISTHVQTDTVPGNDVDTDTTVLPTGAATLTADPGGAMTVLADGGSFDYGKVDLTLASKTVTYRYFNGTFEYASIDCIAITAEMFAGEFTILGAGLPTACGDAGVDDIVLASGAHYDFTVTFDPKNDPLVLGPFVMRGRMKVTAIPASESFTIDFDGTATEAELEVTKIRLSPDPNPNCNDLVTFLVTLTNNGSAVVGAAADASGMTIEDVLGDGYVSVSGSSASGGVAVAGNKVTWTPALLPVLGSVTLTVWGNVGPGTIALEDYENDVEITGIGQTDTVAGNDLDNDDSVEPDGCVFQPGKDVVLKLIGGVPQILDEYGDVLETPTTDWFDYSGGLFVTAENILFDFTDGSPIPPDSVVFTGSGTTSTITMDGNLLGSLIPTIEYQFSNEHDGRIILGGDEIIHFYNLKPIVDLLFAATKTFSYAAALSAPDHVITLNGDGDPGGMGDGISWIDCENCGEEVSFLNPVLRLEVLTGYGNDTVTAGMIDMPIAPTFTGVYLYGGDAAGTPDGDDRFVVTPSTAYETYVDGDDQSVATGCFGDILDLALAGVSGADLDIAVPALRQGTWSFDAPHKAVNFTDIEGHDDADVTLSLEVSPELVYATDFRTVVITVENTGSDQAACVEVDVPLSLTKIFSEDDFSVAPTLELFDENGVGPVVAGTYDPSTATSDSTWTIGYMGPGYSATFSVMGLVSNFKRMPDEFLITASTDGVEESVVFETHPGFRFPLTTFVNSAAYVAKEFDAVPQPVSDGDGTTVDDVVFDVLVAGLFQGAPGITGGVWCKIPNEIFVDRYAPAGPLTDPYGEDDNVIWPGDNAVDGADSGNPLETIDPPARALGELWRPCSGSFSSKTDANPYTSEFDQGIELPFPLHVNGLYFDTIREDPGTGAFPVDSEVKAVLWLATWGSAGLYKSYDGGETWLAAWPELGPGDVQTGTYWTNIYAITEDEAGFLYASANDGYVLRSLNHGLTWQTVGSLPHVDADTPWSLHGDLQVPGVVYAGTFGRGLFYTTDYGYTWEELDNLATVANENRALYSAPNNAGHIFEIELAVNPADGDTYIFAGTGNGVWRARLNGANHALASEWVFIGPEVKLQDNSFVRPEVHALAMIPEGFLNDDDSPDDGDLLAGLWGNFLVAGDIYSAEMFDEPFATPFGPTPLYTPYVLRGRQVTAFVVASDGTVAVVTDRGLVILDPMQAVTSTASEPVVHDEIPAGFALDQNYPNPFNPVTTIRFEVPATGRVRLEVFDLLGRRVATLVDGVREAAVHEVVFDAAGLSSGTYVYRLQTTSETLSKTLVLMK